MIKKFANKFRHIQQDVHVYELIKGSTKAFVLRVLAASLAFALNVILARQLGANGSGIFFLALTVVMIGASIGSIGMEQVLVRFVASSIAMRQIGRVVGVYQKAMLFSLIAATLVSVCFCLYSPWVSQVVFNKPELAQPLMIMSLAIVPVALFTLHSYALQGLKKVTASILIQGIVVPLLMCFIAAFFVTDFGISAMAWGYIFAALMSLILGRWFWKNAVGSLDFEKASFNRSELFITSWPLFGVVLMSLIVSWLPMVFLGVWETSQDVGIYNAAFRTAALTGFILVAVGSIATPKFAALYQQGDLNTLEVFVRQSTRLVSFLALPIWLFLLVFSESVLSIFGEEFKQGSVVLMILATGQFVNVATGLVGSLLMMTGNERLVRNNLVLTGFMGVLWSLWLIPHYGVVGAAVSTALMLSMQNVIAVIQVWKKLNIMALPWVNVKHTEKVNR